MQAASSKIAAFINPSYPRDHKTPAVQKPFDELRPTTIHQSLPTTCMPAAHPPNSHPSHGTMLLLTKLAPLFVLPLTLASAQLSSNPSTAPALQRHGTTVDGHLYICSLPYWKGKCANLGFKTGVCGEWKLWNYTTAPK